MDYKDLGLRVRECRKQRGMTQEELAAKTGISASFLGHVERGSRVASIDTLVALCNTLGVKADYLLAASLNVYESSMPEGLSQVDRTRLSQFLRLAQDTVSKWND